MQNFVRFHAIEPKIELSQEMWEKRISSAPYQAISSKLKSMLSLKVNILYAKFCTIPYNRIRERTITRIMGKTE